MLLGYCFSTGNSIVKRALKAMTLVIWVFYTLVTVNANRIPRQNLCWYSRDAASQRKTGSCSEMGKKKKKSGESAFPDGDCKVCISHAIKEVFQENTISQVHYFLFESICLPCLLLSDKGGENLLLFTENPRLAFIYTFALKHTLSSESIGSLNEA